MPPPLQYERTANFEDSRTGGVTAVAFSPSGKYLASAGLDRRVCIWEVDSRKLIHNFVTSSIVLSVAWVPDRDGMLLCGCQDGSVNVLTTPSPSILQGASLPRTHSFPVEHLAVKGEHLASGAHGEVGIWELCSNGEWSHLLDLEPPAKNSFNVYREVLVTSVHWTVSKLGAPLLLVTYLYHGYVVYNANDWTQILAIPLNLVANASITGDGSMLAVSNMMSGFDVYHTDTGTSCGTLSHTIGRLHVVPVLFAHGGNAIVGGSCVGEVAVWDATTLRKHQTLLLRDDDKILSLAAHYDTPRDRFLLATAAVNEDVNAAITLWCAEDHEGAKKPIGRARRIWILMSEWFPPLLSGLIGLLGAFLIFLLAAFAVRAAWFSA